MNSNRGTVVLAVVFAMAAVDAHAQRGSLRGKLVDEDGKPLEGVECSIELSGGGGRSSSVTSKDDGQFVKGGMQPGTYTIECEKEGFRPLTLATQVSAFDQAYLGERVMYRLQPGELSETEHARATELLAKFNMASDSEDHQTTLTSLQELAKMMPDNPEIEFNMGGTYEKMGELDKAVEHYRRAAELKPDFYDAWIAAADILGKREQWAEAAAAMKKGLDLKATDPIALFNYSVYAQNAGDLESAKWGLEKTLEVDPGRALAHYQLGLIAVNEGENEAAVAHLEKFLELAPDHAQAEAAKQVIEALKQKGSQD